MDKTKTGLVLLAAGNGSRMQAEKNKALVSLGGKPLFMHALSAFAASGAVGEAVIVCRPEDKREISAALNDLSFPCKLVYGGAVRQDSVYNGLTALSDTVKYVMVHDSARPYITPSVILTCQKSLETYGSAVVGVFSNDTIKRVENGRIIETLDRRALVNIQTPQCFLKETLLDAHAAAKTAGYIGTDDSVLVERMGLPVHFVAGEYTNIKITTPADLKPERTTMKIGHGMDVHAFAMGRKLILGGVTLPFEKGLAGHSDADALTHAVMDALLGAAGLPDIGQQFPDTDETYRGADSLLLLKTVAKMLAKENFRIVNIDATLALQAPKVAPHLPVMRQNIAGALNLPTDAVNIKATTTEHLGFVGRGEGVVCHAVCLVNQGQSWPGLI